jgi:TRAP transporter TAXI family solute receptor
MAAGRFVIFFTVVLVAGLAAPVVAQDIGLITGSDRGTYYRFGLDLQKAVKPAGINLTVLASRGSIENVHAVYQRPGVQVGIVQSDVLAFLTRVQGDPVLSRIAAKTRMVFPLYNEEIHVLGKQEIRTFDDLAGRRVAIGREGSGTYLTARLLFQLAEVTPGESVLIDTTEALTELKAGRIDAMFYVAGAPVALFQNDVTAADALHLIPMTNKSVLEFYPSVEIPANTYAWQPTPVISAAVKAVMVSFDYRRKDCDAVGKFAQVMATQMENLRRTGHAKWKAVDLDAPVRGWQQYDCVKKHLGKTHTATTTPPSRAVTDNPVLDAIKRVLGD